MWRAAAFLGGSLAVALTLGLSLKSGAFEHETEVLGRPIVAFVAVFLLLEAVALLAVWALQRAGGGKTFVLAVALAMRLAWFGSEPVQETDFYRYMWDGQVVLEGVQPYRYPPDVVMETGALHQHRDRFEPHELAEIDRLEAARDQSEASRRSFARISHPELPTIYPPLSLALFAGVQAVAPYSLAGLRVTFCLLDMLVICLLLSMLRNPAWAALYAWHPLVAREFVNSAHVDVLAVACVVSFLWLWQRGKTRGAAVALGMAVLAKLFAIVAAPVFLAALPRERRRPAVLAFVAVLALGYAPVAGFGSLPQFAARWNHNEGALALLRTALDSELLAKGAATLLLFGYVFHRARRVRPTFESGARACGAVIAAAFLLSPVQHPWYATWFLPFLVLFPSGPLLLATATVSLSYLHFAAPAQTSLILWIEHAPVWAWLGIEALRRRGHCLDRATASSACSVRPCISPCTRAPPTACS